MMTLHLTKIMNEILCSSSMLNGELLGHYTRTILYLKVILYAQLKR